MSHPTINATVYDKRGRVLSRGTNSYTRTHPLQQKAARAAGEHKRDFGFMHAETAALVRANPQKAFRISITRFTRDGKPAPAKPCACCQWILTTLFSHLIVEHT